MKPAAFTYHRAQTLSAAIEMLASDSDALVISGGQSLTPLLNLRMTLCDRLVDIGALEELRESSENESFVVIGAGVTHAMIEDGQAPDPAHSLMRRAAASIAYRAIRCHGTIGGSVAMADPAADWPCVLLALDAIAVLSGPHGERRVTMDDLLLGAYETAVRQGEIIRSFEIQKLPAQARTSISKVNRKTGAFANSLAVAVMNGAQSRVVLGAAASRAKILRGASAALARGLSLAEVCAQVAPDIEAILPERDPYLQSLHESNVRRALDEVMAP